MRLKVLKLSLGSVMIAAITSVLLGATPAISQTNELESTDHLFVVSIRQTNLWTLKMSQQASERGFSDSVRSVGKNLYDAHARLDVDTLRAATDLGIVLTNDPNQQQLDWIGEADAKSGDEFDRAYVNLVRSAQAKLFVQGAQVRASTRNSIVRGLAHRAVQVLMRNLTMLENTGLANITAIRASTPTPEFDSVRIISQSLAPGDRELLVKFGQAILWQGPVSRQAADRATDDRVRKASGTLAQEHMQLAQQIYTTAARLDIELPGGPTQQEKSWATEITNSSGKEFDQIYTNLTRAANGSAFVLVAEVRVSTRNDVVRAFAQTAAGVVLRHMALLESTGQVKNSTLRGAPPQAPQPVAAQTSTEPTGDNTILFLAIVAIVSAAGTLWLVRALGNHGEHSKRRRR